MKFNRNRIRALILWLVIAAFPALWSGGVFANSFNAALRQTKQRPAARRQTIKKTNRQPRKRILIEVASIPTPPETVAEMLRLANLKKGNVLYDLGSGDGRIPLEAARAYGVRAVGIEIKPKLVEAANKKAREEGLNKLAKFVHADLFRMSYRDADVVTLYLSDELNLRILPKLLRDLPSGARIISHDFMMGGWQPEISVKVPWKNLYRNVRVWTVPQGRAGRQRVLQQALNADAAADVFSRQ